MILILLVLVFLFLYLYLNEVSKNEKKEEPEKKPTVEWYVEKINDVFYEWKISYDKKGSSKGNSIHFCWKYNKWWKVMVYDHIVFWWDLWFLMENVYDRFYKEKEYRDKMTEQDLYAIIAGCKPKMY